MKLIKALAATAFSFALFAPASFAETSVDFDFEHSVSYSCSMDGLHSVGDTSLSGDVISAEVTGIDISSSNSATEIQYDASDVTVPSGSDAAFVMKVSANPNGNGYASSASEAYSGDAQTLQVKFTGADEAGAYSATVTATCVQA